MECIVLAGGRPRPGEPLYAETGGGPKALVDIGGMRMIDRVVEALRGSKSIDRLIVVGLDAADLAAADDVSPVPAQGSLVANLYAGLGELRSPDEPAAYCWSDIPLLRAGMIDRFLAAADLDCDVCAGLVERSALETRFPGVQELWLRAREGQFVAADFGTFRPARAAELRPDLEALMPQRKSALSQARMVGMPLLLRYVSGSLTLPYLQSALRRRFGIACQINIVPDPELGMDVDTAHDLALCRAAVERHGS
jgi:GTP:adenosylcobinamide-phosphate guanylyltransferase